MKKKAIVILGATAALLGIGGSAAAFFLLNKSKEIENKESTKEQETEDKKDEKTFDVESINLDYPQKELTEVRNIDLGLLSFFNINLEEYRIAGLTIETNNDNPSNVVVTFDVISKETKEVVAKNVKRKIEGFLIREKRESEVHDINEDAKKLSASFLGDKDFLLLEDVNLDNFEVSGYNTDLYDLEIQSLSKNSEEGKAVLAYRLSQKDDITVKSETQFFEVSDLLTESMILNKLRSDLSQISVQTDVDKNQTYARDVLDSQIMFQNLSKKALVNNVSISSLENCLSVTFSLISSGYSREVQLPESKTIEINGFKVDAKESNEPVEIIEEKEVEEKKVNLNSILPSVQVSFDGTKADVFAHDVDSKSVIFSGFDKNQFEVEITDLLPSSTEVLVSFKLKEKNSDNVSSIRQETLIGFKELVVEKNLSEVLNETLIDLNVLISETYSRDVDQENVIFSNLDEEKYLLEITRLNKQDDNVSVSFKVRKLNSDEVSEERSVVFEGFKIPDDSNKDILNVEVSFTGEKENIYSENASKSQISFSAYNTDLYEVRDVSLEAIDSVLSVSFRFFNKRLNTLSSFRTVDITGFKKKPVKQPISQILEQTRVQYIKNVSENYADEVIETDFNITGYDSDKYEIVNKNLIINDRTVTVSFSIKDKETSEVSSLKTSNFGPFKERVVRPDVNDVINSVVVEYTKDKSLNYSKNVISSELRFSGYERYEYQIQDISITNQPGSISVQFKLKDLVSQSVSNLKIASITGFKIKRNIDDVLEDSSISFNGNKSEIYPDQVQKDMLSISEMDSIYSLEALSFTPQSDSISVSYSIRDNEDNITSRLKTLVIPGFKVRENIRTALSNVRVILKVDEEQTFANEVNNDSLDFESYDKNEFDLNIDRIDRNGSEVSVYFKLIRKYNNEESPLRVQRYKNFKEGSRSTEDKLNQITATLSNNGYFVDDTYNVVISLNNVSRDLEPVNIIWYKEGVRISNQSSKQLNVTKNSISSDTNFSVRISSGAQNRTINNLTVRILNPLRSATLSASSRGLMIEGLSSVSKVKWYKGDVLVNTSSNLSYATTVKGIYYAIVESADGTQFKTNSVEIENKTYLNEVPSFKEKLTNKISITTSQSKTISSQTRTPQSEFYQTDLETRYKQYNFKYPGYNYDYSGPTSNHEYSFLTVPVDGQMRRVNISDMLLEERVPGTQSRTNPKDKGKKYNDANWISQEIQNNRLKKHPYTKNAYINDVQDSTKSVTKNVVVSGAMAGYTSFGLYIPAGEVANITFSADFMKFLTNKYRNTPNVALPFQLILNQNYWDSYPYNDTGRINTRYPFMKTTFAFKFSDIQNNTLKIGSPFGGPITLLLNNQLIDNMGYNVNFEATVSNAVEMLFYQHGVTTEQDWNEQIRKVQSREIAAPMVAIQTNYSSILVPFDPEKQTHSIAGLTIDKFKYPKENLQKWDSFYKTSQEWSDFGTSRIALNYARGIWKNAAAWGGGANLWAPVEWARSYFEGLSDFGFGGWGNYHEINHNFESHQDPFNVRNHGWTNIPSLLNLTYLNDRTRYRNLHDWDGNMTAGWATLSNAFVVSDTAKQGDWYRMYASFLYAMGRDKFMEWVKQSSRQGHHAHQVSNPIYTTKFMIDKFGLNFHYAALSLKGMRTIGSNGDNEARQRNRRWLDAFPLRNEIQKDAYASIYDSFYNYPAVDFVGNLYASGQFIYESRANSFDYTGDVMPAFEIPAFEPYTFDFEKGISSANPNFTWTLGSVPRTTKLGGTLRVNGKKITYTANKESLNEIDEFDLEIIPGSWSGKPTKYVPKYKFKIKIRNVVNQPKLTLYPKMRGSLNNINDALNASSLPVNQRNSVTISQGWKSGQLNYFSKRNEPNLSNTLMVVEAKFVAPITGTLEFWGYFDDEYRITVDGQVKKHERSQENQIKSPFEMRFEKGRVYNFKIEVFNQFGAGRAQYWFTEPVSQQKYYLEENSLAPGYAANKSKTGVSVDQLINNKEYKYQPRFRDEDELNQNEISRYAPSEKGDEVYFVDADNAYAADTLGSFPIRNAFDQNLYTKYEQKRSNKTGFRLRMPKPRIINYLEVTRFSAATSDFVPNWYRITTANTDASTNEVLFEGFINTSFASSEKARIFFNKSIYTQAIHVEMERRSKDSFTPSGSGITLSEINLGYKVKPQELIPANSEKINYYGSWELLNNDDERVYSVVNNIASRTTTEGDFIEFDLEGNEFTLVGKKSRNGSSFRIYVDDQVVVDSVSTVDPTQNFNAPIFQRVLAINSNQKHKIKIENLENKELVINYIVTSKP
ncbi:M60 family metallopeptidase [Mycoplasma sp. Ms02]|uniref:M60 family metallopeptidase n=1 Tax=Mycoplasma sp. Ms02 TaxID=353851 RepID=UPI001C89622A|nr:M60 family metallopeptidase [Mycoplasma sp. Ms02]QZE12677.1 M60 family metallopeptidase [Mycoplasma sp. Ms02]